MAQVHTTVRVLRPHITNELEWDMRTTGPPANVSRAHVWDGHRRCSQCPPRSLLEADGFLGVPQEENSEGCGRGLFPR